MQNLFIFEEIHAKLLMPIAANLTTYTFRYGEYLQKEGEIPKGLIIIKSGQCKVALNRIATRKIQEHEPLLID